MFGAANVGLYQRRPDEEGEDSLRLVASSNNSLVGTVLHRGEGMAWQLVDSDAPYLTTADYSTYAHRSIPLESSFGSVLEVPLERLRERIGVIYLSDVIGRRFTDFDAELLRRLADVAIVALQQRDLFGRVEQLSEAITAISRDLGSTPLDSKLTEIAEHATRILNAEQCDVFRLITPEQLTLQAGYGKTDVDIEQVQVFEIRDGAQMTFPAVLAERLIAGRDLVVNRCGEGLRELLGVGGLVETEVSSRIHSVLAIPLLTKAGERVTVSGMLCVTNKTSANGHASPDACFNDEDIWILRVFAESAVVAIESTRLFGELRAQKDLYEQLLAAWNILASEEPLKSRLNKIAESIVLILRKTYCRILLTEESDEVLTLKAVALHPRIDDVRQYTWNPERKQRTAISLWPHLRIAFRTGLPYELNSERDGGTLAKLSDILGLRDSITGDPVPIHNVFSIPMAAGNRPVGLISIGEVRRPTLERGGFSTEAKNLATAIAAQATVMIDREWRRQTSERREELLSRLSDSAVQIRTEADDERRLFLIAQQVQLVFRCDVAGLLEQTRPGGPIVVYTSMGEALHIDGSTAAASGLNDILAEEVMTQSVSTIFERISHNLPALQMLRLSSAIAVRFDYASRARCVLFVGDQGDDSTLVSEDLRILETLAAHCAAALTTTRARVQLTRALNGVHLVAEDLALGDGGHALDRVVAGIRNAMDSDLVTLYRIEREGQAIIGYPTKTTLLDPSVSTALVRDVSSSAVGKVLAAEADMIMADDVRHNAALNGPFVQREKVVSAIGMKIRPQTATESVGVLFVNYTSFRKFTDDDARVVKMFAHLAAVAIQNQDLYDRQRRKARQQEALRKAARALSEDIELADTPQQIANVAHDVGTSFVSDITVVVVGLFSEGTGRVGATYPAEAAELVRSRIHHEVPLTPGDISDRVGVLGRAVLSGEIQIRNDVSIATDPDYIPIDDRTKSMLAVPITEGGQSFGAINIESADPFAFADDDRETFELLASFALDALRSAKKNADLERMRAGAQPDAVWKEISFSAAHKIGNPIFAIETNLGPLEKRVAEGRTTEAQDVIDDIRVSVEKAKGIVGQFKSLSRAHDVKPTPTLLRPILEEACAATGHRNAVTVIDCSETIKVLGDVRRLTECFDELVANALHWIDSAQGQIRIAVSEAELPLPGELDANRPYLRINFRDNGPGVPAKLKNQIFDAFFTTHKQGNGLGLDLVRRIIQGHGGAIAEKGVPGEGADFEMYLPSAKQLFRK
ncbi:MAG TPA: GAF domain-containing protein [Candidatus Acidoferrum sp.]|nr:GAF domain-containing protein [Candidatus Acidoferrum sp.]